MSAPVTAVYYDGLTSKPHDALVSVREPNSLEVEVEGDRFHWPLEHKGMKWERNGDMLRLNFGEHPRKVLIVRDALFIKSFVMRMQFSGRRGVYDRTLSAARRGPILFFLAVAAIVVVGYVWVLPWTAERLAMLAPRSMDVQLGNVAFEQMSLGMEMDEERSATLQAFGDRLEFSPNYDLRYHVVDDPMVNAFALPGGHIVVFTGILERMDEPEELAALLAHEATHVEERHSTRMMVRSMAGYLFLSLLLGDVNAIVAVAAENADKLRNMSYGRGLESEADGVGQERMKENGVDPMGMVQLLELLEEEAMDMPEAMEFLSTHPLTKDRVENAQKRAAELGPVDATDPELLSLFGSLKGTAGDQEEAISPSDPAP